MLSTCVKLSAVSNTTCCSCSTFHGKDFDRNQNDCNCSCLTFHRKDFNIHHQKPEWLQLLLFNLYGKDFNIHHQKPECLQLRWPGTSRPPSPPTPLPPPPPSTSTHRKWKWKQTRRQSLGVVHLLSQQSWRDEGAFSGRLYVTGLSELTAGSSKRIWVCFRYKGYFLSIEQFRLLPFVKTKILIYREISTYICQSVTKTGI